MFLLIALKGFSDSQGSKSMDVARWIVVKVSHLNNISCLQNSVNFEYLNIIFNLV